MKKLVCGAVIGIVCSSFVMAGLDDSAKMAQSADKVTSKVAYADAGGGSGIAVVPTVGGAAVAADVGQVAKDGLWASIKNIPNNYPKTTTAIGVLAAVAPIIANNPKLLGLAKKDSTPSATGTTATHTGADNSVQVNVAGNSGSSITIVLQSPTITKKK